MNSDRISEAQHQAAVVELAQMHNWLVYYVPDSRRSPAGFPDLVLVRPPQVLFVECKTDKGTLRPEQREWMEALSRCNSVQVWVWRPSDWPKIEAMLMGGNSDA